MGTPSLVGLVLFFALSALVVTNIPIVHAAEIVTLDASNWDDAAPRGKEVDCIYGDYVLRNDKIIAVIANAVPTRNANMTVRHVGGAVIDLTRRDASNDQLSAFYPAAGCDLSMEDGFSPVGGINSSITGDVVQPRSVRINGAAKLSFTTKADTSKPNVQVRYTLADDADWLTVETTYTNPHDEPIEVSFRDPIRVDGEFLMAYDSDENLFWAYDAGWGQAYGVVADGATIVPDMESLEKQRPVLRYEIDGKTTFELQKGESITLKRHLFPANDLFALQQIRDGFDAKAHEAQLTQSLFPQTISVRDPSGPVANALVTVRFPDGKIFGQGRTDDDGKLLAVLPAGTYQGKVAADGRLSFEGPLEVESDSDHSIELDAPGVVAAKITDEAGEPIPCKVVFRGVNGTPDPSWGPDSMIYGVRNLRYTPDGTFRAEVLPGEYSVLICHGPEYDAVQQSIKVTEGHVTSIAAVLVRSVATPGWMSADLHSHSTPSGDNTASQRGRVLNHLAEHIEFAPCTEHNRITTYLPHLEFFDAVHRIATCPGMELTGSALPVNHQNAFPLIPKPRTQDGGGPTTDNNPVVQIERLAMWDDGSDKLVQSDHPNLMQILGDRDNDGTADGGFSEMFQHMDVVEIHPLENVLDPPPTKLPTNAFERVVFHWFQLMNLGYRIPGVVNTDAHWNFHGVGWNRNYIQCEDDDPAKVNVMDLCHAAERGAVIVTNGPYLEVSAKGKNNGAEQSAVPGGDLVDGDGAVAFHVRVQCANWLDVNRVALFINGRLSDQHDFTRGTHPQMFQSGVVKFDQTIPINLDADAHVVVVAAGEGLTLGEIYGPIHGKSKPVALANPIFVDIDGNGFQPNGDMLGLHAPIEKTQLPGAKTQAAE